MDKEHLINSETRHRNSDRICTHGQSIRMNRYADSSSAACAAASRATGTRYGLQLT